jgi:hypothetical protein
MKIYFLLIAALLFINTGCRKDKVQKPACNISQLTSPAGKKIKITYNAEGKYAKIENGETGETSIPVYSPGAIIYTITNSSTSTLVRKITIALNNSGMASSLKQEQYNAAGAPTSLSNTVYEYNGTQLIKSTFSLPGSSSTSINTYSWTNGNMTSSYNDINATDFEYYADKPVQQGDWISIINLINTGFDYTMIVKNKNLMKNYFGSLLSYRFDSEGKINAIYQDGTLLYNMEYECN